MCSIELSCSRHFGLPLTTQIISANQSLFVQKITCNLTHIIIITCKNSLTKASTLKNLPRQIGQSSLGLKTRTYQGSDHQQRSSGVYLTQAAVSSVLDQYSFHAAYESLLPIPSCIVQNRIREITKHQLFGILLLSVITFCQSSNSCPKIKQKNDNRLSCKNSSIHYLPCHRPKHYTCCNCASILLRLSRFVSIIINVQLAQTSVALK